MGPKKDAKKGGATFEVDPALYQRPPVKYPVTVEDVAALQPLLKSSLLKVADVLPAWDITDVKWGEAVEADNAEVAITYPAHIQVTEKKPLRVYLKLEADEPVIVDPKAKGKKPDAKKGAVEEGLTEPEVDVETGKTLPRMFLASVDVQNTPIEPAGFEAARPFKSKLDAAQRTRKAEYDRLSAEITAATEEAAAAPDGTEEGQKGFLEQKAAALAKSYAEALKANDVGDEAPRGGLVDPLLVSAFDIVARMGPGVVGGKDEAAPEEGMQYLWRSIYPKLPDSNRPCYNPAGKYYVRLYLGGAWRMVLVTDEVPLDANGDCVVACSSNPLELWPMILAKAIYAAYGKCGYNGSLGAPLDDAVHGSCTRSAAFFYSFAVHVLTGWQPGSPLELSACLTDDISRTRTLREEIVFGGASFVDPEQIPGSLEKLLAAENKHDKKESMEEGGDAEVTSSLGGLRTKKQFKEDYMRKQSEREAVINILKLRESMIANIEAATRKPFTEAFSVCYRDGEGSLRVAPVLAISYTKVEGDAEENLGQTRVLVNWQVIKKAPFVEPYVDVSKLSAVEQYKAALPKLPIPTEVVMEWVTLSELQSGSAHIIAHDTLLRTGNSACLPWNWTADVSEEAVDGKSKGKDKKGKDTALAGPTGGPVLCVEAGQLEPTLLKVDNAVFFQPAPAEKSAPAAAAEDEEAAAALAAQADELSRVSSSAMMVPLAPSLSLSIMIHADMPVQETPSTEESAAEAEVATVQQKLPSGVVVVLQEVRTDDLDPLVMRVELGQDAFVPMTRVTFHVPAERLSPNGKEPLLFWVRLYTQASVSMTFKCGVPVTVGAAETIWESCGEDFKSLVKTGKAASTAADTEQILFRLPLQLATEAQTDVVTEKALVCVHVPDATLAQHISAGLFSDQRIRPYDPETHEPNPEDAVEIEKSAVNFANSQFLPRLGPVCTTLSNQGMTTLLVRCQLNRFLQEKTTGSKELSLPLSDVPGTSWKTVILTKNRALVPPANLQTNNKPARYIGAYYPNRNLTMFRDVIAFEKASFPLALSFGVRPSAEKAVPVPAEAAAETSAEGAEAPAESSEEEKTSTAVAVKKYAAVPTYGKSSDADLHAMPPVHTSEFCEQVMLRLRLYRKSDSHLVYECTGNGSVSLYNVVINSFLEKGEEAPVRSSDDAPPADAKGGKKDDKKGKGTPTGGSGDDVEMIVELSVDEDFMSVPAAWRSRLPYIFHAGAEGLDSTDPGAVQAVVDAQVAAASLALTEGRDPGSAIFANIAPVHPQFLWSYDILSGTVSAVQHDYSDIEKLMKMKQGWADLMPSRDEFQLESSHYFTKKLALQVSQGEAKSSTAEPGEPVPVEYFTAEISEHLEKAIYAKEPGAAKKRLETVFPAGGNPFKENISGSGESRVFQSHEDSTAIRKIRVTETANQKQAADLGLKKLFSFNDQMREQTSARINELVNAAYDAERLPTSEGDALEKPSASTILEWWTMREKYRTDTDKLNESLTAVLGRAAAAIENSLVAEGGGDPKKKKK